MPLTETRLPALKKKTKSHKVADQRGLYIEATPAGSKLSRSAIVSAKLRRSLRSADNLIDHEVLDPSSVSVGDYVAATMAGDTFASDKVTPMISANNLEADSREALRLVESIETSGDTALMYEVSDVQVWANLGLHLAEKLRGVAALQNYRFAVDGFFVGKAVHYTYTIGDQGVELLEFRAATEFGIRLLGATSEWGKKALASAGMAMPDWPGEPWPSELS